MIHTAYTVRMLRITALVLAIALVAWGTGLSSFFYTAEAASITTASDTISDSRPSTAANHAFQFTTPNGMPANATIEITFPNDFTLPGAGFDFNDIDLATTTDEVLGAAAGPTTWGVATSATSITLTAPANFGLASSSVVTIEVGSNATSGATGDSQITNPASTGSYGIDIGGTMPDNGQVRVAIVDAVTVTASVDTSLTFQVNGVAQGITVNGSATSTATTTTSTELPFGTLQTGTSTVVAQDLSVSTNAANGFVVTVHQTDDLRSSIGAIIDGFVDGSYTETPTTWASPANTLGDDTTYGHWGLTSEDTVTTRTAEFGSDEWVAATTSPTVIFSHTSVANGTVAGEGTTRVGYRAEISELQEAGEYSTSLIYVATPIF